MLVVEESEFMGEGGSRHEHVDGVGCEIEDFDENCLSC